MSVTGDTIALSPTTPLHPGEPVQVTATSGIQDVGGDPSSAPFVWQFRTTASGGTGWFSERGQNLTIDVTYFGLKALLGDMARDGNLDAFVANGNASPNRVLLNDGSGSFDDSGRSVGNASSRAVALADLDGDGDLDVLVVTNFGFGDGPNDVWLNDGRGNFNRAQSLGSLYHWSVALGDVDGDGDLDGLVTGNEGIGVWMNQNAVFSGDSNEDGVFDQLLDIVQVLEANKYLSGEPATFAEGDWKDDGVFDENESLASGTYLKGT